MLCYRSNTDYVTFLADRCNATFGYCHEMSSVCLSSVTRVYCGETVSWIRMPLGTEVGLGPCDIVLDGNPAPPTQRGTAALPNFFGPCLQRVSKNDPPLQLAIIFTARRNARIANAVLATAIPSVCLSACQSHAGIVSK